MIMIFGIPGPLLFGQLLLGLINGAFYAMLSLGLAVIFGMLNIINFAHGALFMMGAFASWMLLQYAGIGYFPSLILAPLIIGVFGVILERTVISRLYHLDHLYGLLLTFGLALVIQGLFRNYYGSSGLPYQIPAILSGATDVGFMFLPNYRAWVVVAAAVVCLATWMVIEKTSLGATLRAATENAPLVQAFGVNVPRVITLTYGGGVALAAFAGVLAAPIYSVNPNMGDNFINTVFAVVVIGGMGSIMGSIITGFALGVIEGLTKVFYPAGLGDCRVLSDGDRAADLAARPVRKARLNVRFLPLAADRLPGDVGADHRLPVRVVSGVPDAGAVHGVVRVRVQPDDRLCRPAVIRPRGVLRHGRLHRRVDHEILACRRGDRDHPRRRNRCSAGPVSGLPGDPPVTASTSP